MHEPALDTKDEAPDADRRLESIVAGVMQQVPMAIVVVDEQSWVSMCSQAAAAHGVSPGSSMAGSSIAGSGPLGEAVERLLGPVAAGEPDEIVVDRWHLVRLECNPTTGAQVLLWREPAEAAGSQAQSDRLFGRFGPPWMVASEPGPSADPE